MCDMDELKGAKVERAENAGSVVVLKLEDGRTVYIRPLMTASENKAQAHLDVTILGDEDEKRA